MKVGAPLPPGEVDAQRASGEGWGFAGHAKSALIRPPGIFSRREKDPGPQLLYQSDGPIPAHVTRIVASNAAGNDNAPISTRGNNLRVKYRSS